MSDESTLNIAYLTDVEGRWDKVTSFVEGNPLVALDSDDRLRVRDGATLVFGGDAVDRGPDSLKVVRTLLEAKRAQPERIVLLAGNRDINKLRLARELSGRPLARTPEPERSAGGPPLLRWILSNTMGAKDAFEHRRAELSRGAEPASDEAVFESFRGEVARGGALRAYLSRCALAHRVGDALFVHGGVTDESLGVVPSGAVSEDERSAEYCKVTDDLNTWVDALNGFYRSQMQLFEERAETASLAAAAPWAALVAYQAPLAGTKSNQRSVVYGRTTDALGNPRLPSRTVIDRLRSAGVRRVFVGHSPAGDCPSVLRFEDFSIVFADNSYGRLEAGSQVLLQGEQTLVRGACVLDDGRAVRTHAVWSPGDRSPLGMLTRDERALVKGESSDGEWVLFRALEGYRQEQRTRGRSALGELVPAFSE